MGSCKNSESLLENSKKTKWLQFLQNTGLFLECGFVLLPGVANRCEITSAVAIHMSLQKNVFLPYVARPCD